MITIRLSEDRGPAHHGWLESRHTFSFAGYYDPKYMGVSALRVINDDKVAPGKGFDTHSHRDMEIISYVKKGTIEHKDSMGNIERLPAGEFQLMSAGTGVTHSEYNPSMTDNLEFLQIWIQPDVNGIAPGYQQKMFDRQSGLQLIASPDAHDDSLKIHQNACLYQLLLTRDESCKLDVKGNRSVYVHMVAGQLSINDESLSEGDGATITGLDAIQFTGLGDCEALVFDLP